MRICHVCSGHHASDGRVFRRACVTLAKAGYETHLIATSETKGVYSSESVTIHALPKSKGSIARIQRRKDVAQIARSVQPDLYHVHEPELLSPVLRIAGSKPVIYDVHEAMWIVLRERDWIPKMLRSSVAAAWDIYEKTLLKRCVAVVPATEGVAEHYRGSYSNNVMTISNYPELSEFETLPNARRDGKRCVFIGSITPNRGVAEAVEAIGILQARGVDVEFAIVGSGSESFLCQLRGLAARLKVENRIRFLGQVSRAQAIQLTNESSIGIVAHLPDDPQVIVGLPVKMLEYMGLGIPMVFSNAPTHKALTSQGKVGIGLDQVTPVSIADAIDWLVHNPMEAEEMGRKGKELVRNYYNWDIEGKKLLSLYAKILGESNTSSKERKQE